MNFGVRNAEAAGSIPAPSTKFSQENLRLLHFTPKLQGFVCPLHGCSLTQQDKSVSLYSPQHEMDV